MHEIGHVYCVLHPVHYLYYCVSLLIDFLADISNGA